MSSSNPNEEKESRKIKPRAVGRSVWRKVQQVSSKARDALDNLGSLDFNNPNDLLQLVKYVGDKLGGQVITLAFLATRLKDIIDRDGVERTFNLDGFEFNFFPGMSVDQIKRNLEEFQYFWRRQL